MKSIAVIGPHAAEVELGINGGWPLITVVPLEGIMTRANALGTTVDYSMGCAINGGALRPVDSLCFGKVEGSNRTGVKGEYCDNMNLAGTPVLTRIDSMIHFNYGPGSPVPSMPEDRFSIRWKGEIIPPDTIHHIGTSTDDGVLLCLDGQLVIDDWRDHSEEPNRAKVDLRPGKEYEVELQYYDDGLGAGARLTWDLNPQDFNAARKIAAKSDVVVLVLGINPTISREEHDRTAIELPQIQRELIAQIASVNPNIVVVLENGGPVAPAGTENKGGAIVEAWYPGDFGGKAIADVLFGDLKPGGKLPETLYASTQQLPPMSSYDLINHSRMYMYFDQPVLFPFGHGSSYTQRGYSNLFLSADRMKAGGEV